MHRTLTLSVVRIPFTPDSQSISRIILVRISSGRSTIFRRVDLVDIGGGGETRGKAPIHMCDVIQIGVYRSANLKFQRDINYYIF